MQPSASWAMQFTFLLEMDEETVNSSCCPDSVSVEMACRPQPTANNIRRKNAFLIIFIFAKVQIKNFV